MSSNIVDRLQLHHQPVEPEPQAFKEAVLAAALAKCDARGHLVDDAQARLQISRQSALSAFRKCSKTRPAKLVVSGSRHHLIDVFLLFCGRGAARPEPKLLGLFVWSAMLFASSSSTW